MRVTHIIDRLDVLGGVQTYLSTLIPALTSAGVESVVLASSGPRTLDGAKVSSFRWSACDDPLGGAREQAAIRESIAATRPDITLCHIAPSPGVAAAAAAHGPTVVFAHDFFPICPGNARFLQTSRRFCDEGPGARCFLRAYTERCAARDPRRLIKRVGAVRSWRHTWHALAGVFVASPFMKEQLIRDGTPRDLVSVLPYPVIPPATEVPGMAQRPSDLLFLGRLDPTKGADTLLRAVVDLPGASATIAGAGWELERLQQLARDLGVEGRVTFAGGVEPEQRANLLRSSKIFVLPSVWQEPFGIAGVEALAAGLPVVATRVGGVPSWMTPEVGYLIEPDDAAALVDAAGRILGDAALWHSMSARAAQQAQRFGLDRHVQSLIALLHTATRRAVR
jgi:glycosyltransferase involved in cell wall biosynthesis